MIQCSMPLTPKAKLPAAPVACYLSNVSFSRRACHIFLQVQTSSDLNLADPSHRKGSCSLLMLPPLNSLCINYTLTTMLLLVCLHLRRLHSQQAGGPSVLILLTTSRGVGDRLPLIASLSAHTHSRLCPTD